MKRSAFNESRDHRIADESQQDRSLMCSAHGCPNRWSTNDGRLCRWHAAADRSHWPQVTQEQLDAETERALYAAAPKAEASQVRLTPREKRDILLRAQDMFARKRAPDYDKRAWIKKLEGKAARGEPLSAAQKHCLQQMRKPRPIVEDLDA